MPRLLPLVFCSSEKVPARITTARSALASVATAPFAFIQAIFLDPPKTARAEIAEAPAALLASQYLLILALTTSLASSLWDAVVVGSTALAGTTRQIYNGNGQTYTFYVLSYFVVLYAACGGFR
jgi:hypothetical protein